jgi:hypothetical protein
MRSEILSLNTEDIRWKAAVDMWEKTALDVFLPSSETPYLRVCFLVFLLPLIF